MPLDDEDPVLSVSKWVRCSNCLGSGRWVDGSDCADCGGTGTVQSVFKARPRHLLADARVRSLVEIVRAYRDGGPVAAGAVDAALAPFEAVEES